MGIRDWFRRTFDPGSERQDALARLDAVLETMHDVRMVLRNAGAEVDGRSIVEAVRSLAADRDDVDREIVELKKQVEGFARDNLAKAEEVVRLHSELADARHVVDQCEADRNALAAERDDIKAARAAAVKAEAELLVRCQRYHDRLAAVADAASKPVD